MGGQADKSEARPKANLDSLVQDILQRVLEVERRREGASFSERSYADQPILRKGSDWRRERERQGQQGRPPQKQAGQGQNPQERRRQEQPRHSQPHQGRAIASSRAERARRAYQSQARFDLQPTQRVELLPRPDLPPTLARLRELEGSRDEQGAPLRGGRLFAAQARLAADYEEDQPYQGTLPFRYLPTYQVLGDQELRGYFSWRTLWRRGEATDAPSTFARLLSYELVNGVGSEPGTPTALELRRLVERCKAQSNGLPAGAGGIALDLEHLLRDYVVCNQLDPKLATSEEERSFAQAVMTLRRAERARLCEEGLRGLSPDALEVPAPTAAELWEALGRVSSYPPERSPFLRTHADEAAQVAAGVFARLVRHCAKRRKTDFVDGLVGLAQDQAYFPFAGVPLGEEPAKGDLHVHVTAAETITRRFGRWRRRRAFSLEGRSRELGRVIRGIDRQMRDDWDFDRPLKEQHLPAYVTGMIQKESTLELARVREEERRRISFDLSKLGSIRSAAALTREALLVDEEREGYLPEDSPPTAEPPVAASAVPAQPDDSCVPCPADASAVPPAVPQPSSHDEAESPYAKGAGEPEGAAPLTLGLDPEELALLRQLLVGGTAATTPGSRSVEMLADSANEKLFDLLQDSAIEFDDQGPHLVEDYIEDLRGILEP